MPFRSPLWRAVTLLSVALVAFFGIAGLVIAVRSGGSIARAAATAPSQSALTESALTESSAGTTTSPPPTVPPTTEPSSPPPAPSPAPVPAVVASLCHALPAGGLIAAHQAVHPFGVDGGLSAGAQAFAFTLGNAHAEDNLFHSGQAAGENVASIFSSGGCVNDGNLIVQYWLGSPAHRANIDQFSVVGAGVACDGNNTYFVAQYR
jgi:hypothetical protein